METWETLLAIKFVGGREEALQQESSHKDIKTETYKVETEVGVRGKRESEMFIVVKMIKTT